MTSFLTGMLAVIMATPCTAPFMATSIGFALTQPIAINLLLFTALGLGFGSPYLIIACFPNLTNYLLNRPLDGKSKKISIYTNFHDSNLACMDFVFTNSHLSSNHHLPLAILIITYSRIMETKIEVLILILTIMVCYATNFYVLSKKNAYPDKYYTPKDIITLQGQGKAMFVDVTASWCLSCKVNESIVLNTTEIQELFDDYNVEYIVLDWTNKNDEITTYLKSFNEGVPLYVYYDTQGNTTTLPQILTKKKTRYLITKKINKYTLIMLF